jgi:hypothetical protein
VIAMHMRSQHAAAEKREVTCPYCDSGDTELFSLFGQQLLTVQLYCHSCHTPFEHIKDDELLIEVSRGREAHSNSPATPGE